MSRFPSERQVYSDPDTGRRVTRWTASPHRDQHLYFTSFSVTADDRFLVFLSDRTGAPNLFVIDRPDGGIRPLTDNTAGLLRAYCYPGGGRRGLAKPTPCLDPVRDVVYYVQDDAVWAAELATGARRRLTDIPTGWWTGFTHISPDGRTLCVPLADPRAFPPGQSTQEDQLITVPHEMVRHGYVTRVYLVDTASGAMRLHAEVPFWVTHVAFDPAGSGRIVFNNEGFHPDWTTIRPRIWRLEADGRFSPLFDQPLDTYVNHENFCPTPDAAGEHPIVYHGLTSAATGKRPYIAARRWSGELVFQAFLPREPEIHHAIGTRDPQSVLVDAHDGFVSHITVATDPPTVTRLCRHDSDFSYQDAHPHPLISPHGRSAVFTSDREGSCNVYEVDLGGVKA